MSTIKRYAKLRNLLKEKILSGKYECGDRFYSQNELITKYNLSFSTVTRALDELVKEGLLSRVQGKGTFVNDTTQASRNSSAVSKNVFVFSPVNIQIDGTAIDTAQFYQKLELMRHESISLKFVPHGTGADDLDPYLFSRDPIDFAIFLNPDPGHSDFISQFLKECPGLVVSAAGNPEGIANITLDYARATRQAVEYCLLAGKHTISLAGGNVSTTVMQECLAGYREEIRSAGRTFNESLTRFAKLGEPGVYSTIIEMFDANPGPEISAVIVPDLESAVNVQSALKSMQKRVPEDVLLVCLDPWRFRTEITGEGPVIKTPINALVNLVLGSIDAGVQGIPLLSKTIPLELVAPPSPVCR